MHKKIETLPIILTNYKLVEEKFWKKKSATWPPHEIIFLGWNYPLNEIRVRFTEWFPLIRSLSIKFDWMCSINFGWFTHFHFTTISVFYCSRPSGKGEKPIKHWDCFVSFLNEILKKIENAWWLRLLGCWAGKRKTKKKKRLIGPSVSGVFHLKKKTGPRCVSLLTVFNGVVVPSRWSGLCNTHTHSTHTHTQRWCVSYSDLEITGLLEFLSRQRRNGLSSLVN